MAHGSGDQQNDGSDARSQRGKGWFRHAFAVEAPGPAEPESPEQAEVLDWLCSQVVKRHLTTPVLLALEMLRPLNYCGAQAMFVFQPFVAAIANTHKYELVARFLEHRGSVDYLCTRIEELEAQAHPAPRAADTQEGSKSENQ